MALSRQMRDRPVEAEILIAELTRIDDKPIGSWMRLGASTMKRISSSLSEEASGVSMRSLIVEYPEPHA